MNQEKIGKFIAEQRKNKQLTQVQLAEKLGVSDRSISKWENGKCMPDLSLFTPLCEILDISINELMSGEKIEKENYQKQFEENIVKTIDYSNQKTMNKKMWMAILFVVCGFLITLTAIAIFPSESSWNSIFAILGVIISLIGFSIFTSKLSHGKRLCFNFIFFMCSILFLFGLDFLNFKLNEEAPSFSTYKITINDTILYDTPFYDVYRCHFDTEDEYWVLEKIINMMRIVL